MSFKEHKPQPHSINRQALSVVLSGGHGLAEAVAAFLSDEASCKGWGPNLRNEKDKDLQFFAVAARPNAVSSLRTFSQSENHQVRHAASTAVWSSFRCSSQEMQRLFCKAVMTDLIKFPANACGLLVGKFATSFELSKIGSYRT